MQTLLQGRYGHLLATPAVQMVSLSNSLPLSSLTKHSAWPSQHLSLGLESAVCPADQQMR